MGMPLRVDLCPGSTRPSTATDSTVTNTPARNSPSKPTTRCAPSRHQPRPLDGDDTALVKLGAAWRRTDGQCRQGPVQRHPCHHDRCGRRQEGPAFTYNDVERIVEPWKLSFTRGHWYLSGFDRLREDQRLYRVDRIKDGVSLSGPAKAPVGDVNEPIDLRGWELGDGPVIKATILVDADQAAYARHMLGEVVDRPDGSVTATLNVRNIDAFRSFVLSFLEHAEILKPAELRTDFVEWLEAQR